MRTPTPPPMTETPAWAVGWVYCFDTTAEIQKLGFSTSPERRARENTQLPFECWVDHAFPVGTRNVETWLHNWFRPRHVRGEWFALGTDGMALVRSIAGARSTAGLPEAFRRTPRYLAPYNPAALREALLAAESFGGRLATLRRCNRLSVEQLALRSGLTPWLIERLESDPTADAVWPAVVALARGLGVPTDAFLPDGGNGDGIPSRDGTHSPGLSRR